MNVDGYLINIWVHGLSATLSLLIGAVLLFGIRGARAHRVLGYTWVGLMLVVATTSFGIRDSGGFSWLHGLSLYTIGTVTLGVHAARSGHAQRHRGTMLGTYIGLSLAALGALDPERRLLTWLLG